MIPGQAAAEAAELESRATALGVPRYVSVGPPAPRTGRTGPWDGRWTPARVEADLDLLDASVAIEAWWWTGEVAADFASPVWLDRAVDRADRLARHAEGYAAGLRRHVDQRLPAWRALTG